MSEVAGAGGSREPRRPSHDRTGTVRMRNPTDVASVLNPPEALRARMERTFHAPPATAGAVGPAGARPEQSVRGAVLQILDEHEGRLPFDRLLEAVSARTPQPVSEDPGALADDLKRTYLPGLVEEGRLRLSLEDDGRLTVERRPEADLTRYAGP